MTVGEGQRLILLSAITVLGVEVIKAATTEQEFTSRLFVGGGIAYTTLSGVSEFAPGPAAAFALVMMTTVLIVDGTPAIQYLMGNATPAKKKTTTTKKGSHK